jgi:hypothetical protein
MFVRRYDSVEVIGDDRIRGSTAANRAPRSRSGSAPARTSPKTRQELYREAQRRDLPGRSKMGRDELARALGHG